MKVKLKKMDENARLPEKGRRGDFCYDLVAVSEEEVAPNVWCYGLGFAYEIDREGFNKLKIVDENGNEYAATVDISIDGRGRSSVWKTGMILANCTATLDEFYRGEVKAVFYHVMPNMPRYKVGDKICQAKIGITVPIEWEWVDEINMNTERGTGGFGSTDKK